LNNFFGGVCLRFLFIYFYIFSLLGRDIYFPGFGVSGFFSAGGHLFRSLLTFFRFVSVCHLCELVHMGFGWLQLVFGGCLLSPSLC
jgi:hypothetical protein